MLTNPKYKYIPQLVYANIILSYLDCYIKFYLAVKFPATKVKHIFKKRQATYSNKIKEEKILY